MQIKNATEGALIAFSENFKQRYFYFNNEANETLKVDGQKLKPYYVIDQIGQKRFINSYLSKLTIKGFNFELKELEIKKILEE
jgi:hypothetical protein